MLYHGKSQTQPRCHYCGGKIKKVTKTVYFNRVRRSDDDWVSDRTEVPRTKEEAQRLLNMPILSVRYTDQITTYHKREDGSRYAKTEYIPDGGKRVDKVSVWDGETYENLYFCNGNHAIAFGVLMAKSGHCTKAYNKAVREDQS